MQWSCPSCWQWLEHRCAAGLLVKITGHLIADHAAPAAPAHALERNRARLERHSMCTPTTCSDPRPARR